jgi:hypothetical protein
MISRLMINLRDPELHKPDDRDEALTTTHGGYISTIVLDHAYTTMITTKDTAQSVVFNWGLCITLTLSLGIKVDGAASPKYASGRHCFKFQVVQSKWHDMREV